MSAWTSVPNWADGLTMAWGLTPIRARCRGGWKWATIFAKASCTSATTIAAGLASTLSKTGEGNVLLVDMTLGQESAQQFYQGKGVTNLDQVLETLPKEKKNEGKLVVAAEGSNGFKLPKILPNRFNDIVPKLKASDFDYIIFDMPAVSPISVTPRLASFMDSVLLIIESEKATKDVVERATELLGKTNQNVGAILNKTKSYVPSSLQEEYLGDL